MEVQFRALFHNIMHISETVVKIKIFYIGYKTPLLRHSRYIQIIGK